VTRLIAVDGAAPGIGKSTLCHALTRWLEGSLRTDHFREEEIMSRPEFADVAAQFTTTRVVKPGALLRATADYVAAAQAGGVDAIVADALIPFVPSLIAFGHTENDIDGFLNKLGEAIAVTHPVLVYLDGDPFAALPRAAAREDPGWLGWYIAKMARYDPSPPVHDFASACHHLQRVRETTLRLIRRQEWDLIIVSQTHHRSADEVFTQVRDRLTRLL
jgi:thymidylate kinase